MHFLFHSNVVSNMSSFFTFASMLLKCRRTKIPPRMKKSTMLRAKMDVSSEGNVCCMLHVPISKLSGRLHVLMSKLSGRLHNSTSKLSVSLFALALVVML